MARYTLRQTRAGPTSTCYTAATAPSSSWSVVLLLASLTLATAACDDLRWTASVSAVSLLLAFCFRSSREETLEIFPSLGLQLASCTVHHVSLPVTQTKPWTVRSSRKAHLIPLEHIGKIVVNEGLQGAGGRHYLAVVGNGGEGERRVFVLFPSILPSLDDLIPVWKEAQKHAK